MIGPAIDKFPLEKVQSPPFPSMRIPKMRLWGSGCVPTMSHFNGRSRYHPAPYKTAEACVESKGRSSGDLGSWQRGETPAGWDTKLHPHHFTWGRDCAQESQTDTKMQGKVAKIHREDKFLRAAF